MKVSKKSVNVVVEWSTIVNACVHLTTVNGRPFSSLNDSGLCMLIDALGGNHTINPQNIKQYINATATSIREEIKSLVDKKMICLKIDGVTRKDHFRY